MMAVMIGKSYSRESAIVVGVVIGVVGIVGVVNALLLVAAGDGGVWSAHCLASS